jgi:hypothetical protein
MKPTETLNLTKSLIPILALLFAGCASEQEATHSFRPTQFPFSAKDWHNYESVEFVRPFRLEDYSWLLLEPLDKSATKLPPPSENTYPVALGAMRRGDHIMVRELQDGLRGTLGVSAKKSSVVMPSTSADEENERQIRAMRDALRSKKAGEVEEALKQLREVAAPEAVPDIVACLNHKSANVVRDACRTLAVLGDKDVIPSIEPLLNDPRSDVRKDAKDAVDQLRAKPAGEITERALILRGKLEQIDPGSMALRIWIGMGSGLPNVRITGEIIDAKSKETLIRFERDRVGALRKAGYDEALDHCFEVLADDVEYLLNVFKGSQ